MKSPGTSEPAPLPPRPRPRGLVPALLAASLLVALAATSATAGTYGDRLVGEGNEFFRAGNYMRASESYREAVLEEPADGLKKLYFGHSLFALGNYAYAAYSFRRGIRYLGYPDDLKLDLVPLFGSRTAFERAMRDVRRYAQYYPSDPHALTVIAYAAFFSGDRAEAAGAVKRLLAIDASDPLAAYVQRRIEIEAGGTPTRPPPATAPVKPEGTQRASPFEVPPPDPARATTPPPSAPRATGATQVEKGPAVVEPRTRPPERTPAPPPVASAPELPAGERTGPAVVFSDEDAAPAVAR